MIYDIHQERCQKWMVTEEISQIYGKLEEHNSGFSKQKKNWTVVIHGMQEKNDDVGCENEGIGITLVRHWKENGNSEAAWFDSWPLMIYSPGVEENLVDGKCSVGY